MATKPRVLLVDDEITVLLTIKAVLEINEYDVDTATSAREGRSRIRTREYDMIITDMRMENDAAGIQVIKEARSAPYQPAVALLTGFPVDEEDWQKLGEVTLLVKATGTQQLLADLKNLLAKRDARLAAATETTPAVAAPAVKKTPAKKAPAKKIAKPVVTVKAAAKVPAKKVVAKKAVKAVAAKPVAKKVAIKKAAAKPAVRAAAKPVAARKAVATKAVAKKVAGKKAAVKTIVARKTVAKKAAGKPVKRGK